MNSLEQNSFNNLGNDLFSNIFYYLEAKDLCTIQKVSKKLNSLASNEWRKETHNNLSNRVWLSEKFLKDQIDQMPKSIFQGIQSTFENLSLEEKTAAQQELEADKESINNKLQKIADLAAPLLIQMNAKEYTLIELKLLGNLINSPNGKAAIIKQVKMAQEINQLMQVIIQKVFSE